MAVNQTRIANITPEEAHELNQSTGTPVEAMKQHQIQEEAKQTFNKKVYLCQMKNPVKSSVFEPEPELFRLPSLRRVCRSAGITDNGEIYLRRFTAKEENIMQKTYSSLVKNNKLTTAGIFNTINEAINNCIRSDVNIYDLPIIDKMAIFKKIVSISYGSKTEVTGQCPYCESNNKTEIDIDTDLETRYITDDFEVSKDIKLTAFDFDVYVTCSQLLVKHENVWAQNESDMINQLKCVITGIHGTLPDGQSIDMRHIDEIIGNLNKTDKRAIADFISSSEAIGVDFDKEFEMICENDQCSNYKAPYKFTISSADLFIKIFND